MDRDEGVGADSSIHSDEEGQCWAPASSWKGSGSQQPGSVRPMGGLHCGEGSIIGALKEVFGDVTISVCVGACRFQHPFREGAAHLVLVTRLIGPTQLEDSGLLVGVEGAGLSYQSKLGHLPGCEHPSTVGITQRRGTCHILGTFKRSHLQLHDLAERIYIEIIAPKGTLSNLPSFNSAQPCYIHFPSSAVFQ